MARIDEMLVRTVSGLAIALPLLVAGDIAAAIADSAEGLPNRPIVDGHPIQPRANQFNGTNSKTPGDVSTQEAKEIDRLYRQLLRGSASPNSQVR